mmetsp:Transcript_14919/g.62903  ORF Transcript_14919/g.62903 Transcript_14919/m.62903 type:complete len:205 (+) Transcript_14919:2272-2886(+)
MWVPRGAPAASKSTNCSSPLLIKTNRSPAGAADLGKTCALRAGALTTTRAGRYGAPSSSPALAGRRRVPDAARDGSRRDPHRRRLVAARRTAPRVPHSASASASRDVAPPGGHRVRGPSPLRAAHDAQAAARQVRRGRAHLRRHRVRLPERGARRHGGHRRRACRGLSRDGRPRPRHNLTHNPRRDAQPLQGGVARREPPVARG